MCELTDNLYVIHRGYINELRLRVDECRRLGYMDCGTYYELLYLRELVLSMNNPESSDMLTWIGVELAYHSPHTLKPFEWYAKSKPGKQTYDVSVSADSVSYTVTMLVFTLVYTVLSILLDIAMRSHGVLIGMLLWYVTILLFSAPYWVDFLYVLSTPFKFKKTAHNPEVRNREWLTEMCMEREKSPQRKAARSLRKALDTCDSFSTDYFTILAKIELLYNGYLPLED